AKIEEEKKKILEKQQEMMKMKRQSSYNEDIDGQYKLQQIEQNLGIQMQELLQNGDLSKISLNCNPDTDIEQQQYQQPSILEPPTNITPPLSLNQSYSSSLSQSLNQSQIINGKQMKYPTLYDITFRLPKGSLTMVVGAVGSGKSSIGAALIGDIEKQSGIIRIDGSIAYCPQTAWINNNTIRGNITFGSGFNQKRYNEVVRICALEPDFNTLAAGDMTAIGEKGVNLSGGQKARIQLARAVYSDRDIYILDDPLSAVDAHVGRFLLEECIDGKLKGKTRLLMTNQLQYTDKADNVIILNKGRIIAQGTSAQLKQKGINFDEFIIRSNNKEKNNKSKHHHKEKEWHKKNSNNNIIRQSRNRYKLVKDTNDKQIEAAKQIITEEEQQTGSVPWSSYMSYILSLVPILLVIPFLFISIMCDVVSIYQSWWMGNIGDPKSYSSISYYWKISIYAFCCVGQIVFLIIRAIVSAFAVKRSNRLIHHNLLQHVWNNYKQQLDKH
ncbi:MAG: putative ABC transporter C family member 2, partial [Streblomastix strix]